MEKIYYQTYHNGLPPVEELYLKWTGRKLNRDRIQLNSYWFVARDGNKVVGALQLLIICDPIWNRDWGLVEIVFVDPEYRKLDIAKKMMANAEKQASWFGCEFLKLASGYDKKEGHALYWSLGYKEGFAFSKVLRGSYD